MTPPTLARRLLLTLLPPADRDAIVGDLDEEFRRHCLDGGRRSASLWYWRQVLTSAPGALRLRRRALRRERRAEHPAHERLLPQFFQDVRYALRGWRREPLFATTAIATQALGVAIAAAVGSVAYGVFIEPLPYNDPRALVSVVEADRSTFSYPDFATLRQSTRSLSHVAGFNGVSRVLRGRGDDRELVPGGEVTAGFFETLGVVPARGRTFTEAESNPSAPGVIILTHGAWQRRFGGDPALVGGTLTLGGQPHTVVGILPADFEFPLRGMAEFWLPLRMTPEQQQRGDRHWLDVLARRAPGVTDAQVAGDLDLVARLLARDDPKFHGSVRLRAFSLRDAIVARFRPALLVLLGGVALLFAAASANVAGLVLARAGTRVRELSVRAAIGAAPARLLRQQITETLMLTLAGSIAGLAAADTLVRAAVRSLPAAQKVAMLRADQLGVTPEVVAITFVLACAAGVLFGMLPSLRRSTLDLRHALGTRTGTGPSPHARAFLVAAEVSLALMLMTGAGLLARSVYQLSQVSLGFQPKGLLTLRPLLAGPRFNDPAVRDATLARLSAALRELPGVSGVGTIDRLPLGGRGSAAALQVAGRPSAGDSPSVLVRTVSPTYFETMGVPVRGGRAFSDRDRQGAPPVVVVNQTLAAQIFGGHQAIGERVVFDSFPGKPQWEIVGIVGDEQFEELDRQRSPVAYFPYAQNPSGNFAVVIRADSATSIAAAARQAVAQIDRQLLVTGMTTMEDVVTQSAAMFFRRAVLALLGVFALAALLLAAVGVYGTLAYVVSQRTREIGIRLALGARRYEVVAMMLRRGMMPAVIGSVLGVAGSFAVSGFLKSLLFGVQPNDAVTLGASVVFLCGVALLACLVPVARATRVDPAITLRQD